MNLLSEWGDAGSSAWYSHLRLQQTGKQEAAQILSSPGLLCLTDSASHYLSEYLVKLYCELQSCTFHITVIVIIPKNKLLL